MRTELQATWEGQQQSCVQIPLWGNDFGKHPKPAWGWLLPHPQRRNMWTLLNVSEAMEGVDVPPPLGPRPIWMQNTQGLWGWAVWQPGYYNNKKEVRPWVHFIYCKGKNGDALGRPGMDDISIPREWRAVYGWAGPLGPLTGDLQPAPGRLIPPIRGAPIKMTTVANAAPSKNTHKMQPGCWQVNGKAAKQQFRPAQPTWRPGRADQNQADMAKIQMRQYTRGEDGPVRPKDVKSQLAWQKLQKVETNALLTLEEIESKGFYLPNFSNVRERLPKGTDYKDPYNTAADSLDTSDYPMGGPQQTQGGSAVSAQEKELSPEQVALRQKWIEEEAPPKMIRLVERQNWLWSLDKAARLEVDGLPDPIYMCLEQWERLGARKSLDLYAGCVDKKWPGYHSQPWFLNAREVEEAWQEKRINRDCKRICLRLLQRYGHALSPDQISLYKLADYDTMAKSKLADAGWESPPADTTQTSGVAQLDGNPGSSMDGMGK